LIYGKRRKGNGIGRKGKDINGKGGGKGKGEREGKRGEGRWVEDSVDFRNRSTPVPIGCQLKCITRQNEGVDGE